MSTLNRQRTVFSLAMSTALLDPINAVRGTELEETTLHWKSATLEDFRLQHSAAAHSACKLPSSFHLAYDGETVDAVRGTETRRNANPICQFTDVIYFNRQRAVFALVMSTPLLVRSTLLEAQNERKRQNNISNYGCDLLQPTARGVFPCSVSRLACPDQRC